MTGRLPDKVAIITGAGGGICRGIAVCFAREGAHMVAADLNESTAEETAALVRQLGRQALVVKADVTLAADVQRLVDQAIAHFGGVDMLLNGAGISRPVDFLQMTEAEWDATVDTNLKSQFLCAQAVARWWVDNQRRGKIVNISSLEGLFPHPANVHYCVSKAGSRMLTQSLALALGPHRINVNDIAPGIIGAGLTARHMGNPEYVSTIPRKVPLGRAGTPDDVAGAAVFLASDDADYITGATITIDGGRLWASHWTSDYWAGHGA